MLEQPSVAYDIEVIHDCIVRDTDICRKFDSKQTKLELYRKKKKKLDKYPEIKKMIDSEFVSSLDEERGKYVGKVSWLPSQLVITDQRIREMCRNMFTYSEPIAKATGLKFGPCPGLEKLSGCPMFSPKPEGIRAQLDQADIFIAIQSKYFVERAEIPGWHDYLVRKLKKEVEKVLGNVSVTAAFGAGPCQVCHPNQCLGRGKCRAPEQRLFALESVGVPVGQLCKNIALFAGNDDWEIKWIKYFATPRQTIKRWKLTCGLAVRL